jgi:hypothetical protein
MVFASWYHEIKRPGLMKQPLQFVDIDNVPLLVDNLDAASQDRVLGAQGGTAIGLTNAVSSTIC